MATMDRDEWSGIPEPVAIIGMGARFPGASGLRDFWQLLRDGGDAITEVPSERFDIDKVYDPHPQTAGKVITRYGGFIDRVDQFAASFFGIAPREAQRTDPQHRLLLEVAWESLEDAGLIPGDLRGSQTGVFIGMITNDYEDLAFQRPDDIDVYVYTNNQRSVVAGRLSYTFDLRGPSIEVDTACSSSLTAVHLACQSLQRGESTLALAGGVNLILQPHHTIGFSQARMMAPDGRCKFGDIKADGFVRSDGVGLVVLKLLRHALSDRDNVYAVIRGSAVNNDGQTSGYLMTPAIEGQVGVIDHAYRMAGVEPSQVRYVEAHGTGTAAGDPVELQALAKVLGNGRSSDRPFLVGSVKTNIGHTEGAAGIAGLIKAALCLHHRQIPASLHLNHRNPAIPWDELPLHIPTELTPWPEETGPGFAGVSSFGIGGTNAHIVLAGAPPRLNVNAPERSTELLPISAESLDAVRALANAYHDYLTTSDDPWPDICATAGSRRTHHAYRVAVIAGSHDEAATALKHFGEGEPQVGTAQGHVLDNGHPRTVFVFPGQGSQWFGMGRDLVAEEPVFREELERCDIAMRPYVSWSLMERLHAPEDTSSIEEIDSIQPILFAIEVALAALWRSWGVEPDAVIGHSMGEIAAAYVAGALSLDDAVRIICCRSRLLRQVSGRGTMAVLDRSIPQTEAVLAGYADRVSIAVSNSPSSTVISGDPDAIAEILGRLDREGVFCRLVKVDVASHSPHMDPLRPALLDALQGIHPREALIPIYSTVTKARSDGTDFDAEYWVRNLRQPVQFAATVQQLLADGLGVFVELSPNPLLLGAIQQTAGLSAANSVALPSLRRDEPGRAVLLTSLGILYTLGHDIDWRGLHPISSHRAALPSYPWQRERFWLPDGAERDVAARIRQRGSEHPLLGQQVSPATRAGEHIWELDVESSTFPFVEDHRVEGTAVVPAAAYVEMFLAAIHSVFESGSHTLHDINFGQACLLPEREIRTFQLVLDSRAPGTATLQIFSRQTGDTASAWVLHASATVLHGDTREKGQCPRPTISWQEALEHCPDITLVDEHYRTTAARGVEYGPSLRALDDIRSGPRQTLARLQLPEEPRHDAHDYLIHPILLDASLQVLYARILAVTRRSVDLGDGAMYLPVSIQCLQFYGSPGSTGRAVATLQIHQQVDAPFVQGDVMLLDELGTVLAEIRGITFQRVDSSRTDNTDEWFYVPQWERERREQVGILPTDIKARHWLVVSQAPHAESDLVGMLREAGHSCVVAFQGAQCEQTSPDTYALGPCPGEDIKRLLDSKFESSPSPWTDIVLLSSEYASPEGSTAIEDLPGACEEVSTGLMSFVQSIIGVEWDSTPRLWLVTQGSQAVEEGDDLTLATSSIFALGRVLVNEHPELRCTRIDLSLKPATDEVRGLADELLADGNDDEVALRGGSRYVHRLKRYVAPTGPIEPPFRSQSSDEPYSLATANPGILDELHLEAKARHGPKAGEVEIRVLAAGLNFRDILSAMGMLEGYPNGVAPFGHECSGVVAAVGDGVVGFNVGDEVVAVGDHGFASYFVTPAELVAPKPTRLDFHEAVTIPIAFLTAQYALSNLAHLCSGETVLIHAASGGVGLAAVQVAQHLGAKIIATAGSAEKRDYLHSLGIEHVLDSRSLAFADEIMALTGGEGVDVVLNSLAGEFLVKSLSLLAPYGRFIEIGRQDIYQNMHLGLLPFRRNLSFAAVDLDSMLRERPAAMGVMLREILQQVADGVVHPLPMTEFPITQIVDAFHYMSRARHIGKVVVSLQVDEVRVVPSQPDTVRSDRTYLITGGLGGLGLAVAQWLVKQGCRYLVLIGRHGPSEEVATTLDELRRIGAQIYVGAVDVAEETQVESLQEVIADRMPPVCGIVHAAGVLDDATIINQTSDHFRRVMAPKVKGAWNLHRLSHDLPIEHFVLFSSAAVLLGSPGQANYVAANAFLDDLAHYRRQRGLPATSINWGPWSDVGLAARPDRGDRLAQRGMSSMTPVQAVDLFGRLLEETPVQVGVMPMDWSQWQDAYPASAGSSLLARLIDHGAKDASPRSGTANVRDVLLRAPLETRQQVAETHVAEAVGQVLGLAWDRLDRSQPLVRMGLDSLMAVELRSRLERGLGVAIPVLTQQRSVTQLATEVLQNLPREQTLTIDAQQDTVSGPVPLTPRQIAFLRQHVSDPNYSKEQFYKVKGSVVPDVLEEAVNFVVRHHDALRTRFLHEGKTWSQIILPREEQRVCDWIDLRGQEQGDVLNTLQRIGARTRESIDLREGPLLRVVGVDLGGAWDTWLIVLIHHLVMDGHSLRIFKEDQEQAYGAHSRGESVQLPPKTTSFKAWAERLAQQDLLDYRSEDFERWLTLPWETCASFPMDGSGEAHGTLQSVSTTFTVEETASLLSTVSRNYGTGIEHIVLTAVLQVFTTWAGTGPQVVQIHRHGRDPVFPSVDVSRTIGWFTTSYPLLLQVEDRASFGDAMQTLSRQLDKAPSEQTTIEIMRYLLAPGENKTRKRIPPTNIIFNYIGREDSVSNAHSPLVLERPATEIAEASTDIMRLVSWVMVWLTIRNGRLKVALKYHEHAYRQATMEDLMARIEEKITSVLPHS